MDFKKVRKEFKKYFWLFIILPVLGFSIAFAYNQNWQPSWQSTKIIYIVPSVKNDKDNIFLYGWPMNSGEFTDDLIAVLTADDKLKDGRIQKLGPSVLKVFSVSKNQKTAKDHTDMLISQIQKQIENLNAKTGLNFTTVDYGEVVTEKTSKEFYKINLIVGLLLGSIFATIIFYLLIYYKKVF